MISKYFWYFPLPVLLPLLSVAQNLVNFTVYLSAGVPRPKYLVWAVMYIGTIPAAMRGDLEPYLNLRSIP